MSSVFVFYISLVRVLFSVRENVCNNSKKRKVMFFDFQKKRKKRKNVRIIFHGCLMFIVPVYCCQNLTSFRLDVQQWLRMDHIHTRGSGNWITVITERSMWTHFDGLRTKLLLKIFCDFLIRHFKKRKKSCFFLKSEKNVKYVAYSRTLVLFPCFWLSMPVQSIAWKDSSPKLPIICRTGR